jgi:hypothetical protein
MAFLSVNGVELDVLRDTMTEEKREVGDEVVTFGGSVRRQRQGPRYDLKFQTPPMVQAEAFAWDCFVRGMGEKWSFDSHLFGSKGTKPSVTTGASVETALTAKYGAKYVTVTAGNFLRLPFDYVTGDVSTMFWRYASGAWHHYIVKGNGYQVWLDGVSSAVSIASWYATDIVNYRYVEFGDNNSFDDFVILPFQVQSSWITSLYNFHAAYAWPSTPRLYVSGDAVWEGGRRTVLGTSDVSSVMKGVVGGSFVTNARKLSVEFKQVS